jgi:tetratricopeptide (TPR) repeat protein
MRTPRQYLSDRYPWLNITDIFAALFAFILAIVVMWPHARVVTDLVVVTALPGSLALILWVLTFSQKARIQIGRRKLRYKSVRRLALNAATICLPLLIFQQASIYLRTLPLFGARVSDALLPYPESSDYEFRVVVGVAHLEGDDGQKIQTQLYGSLGKLDPRLNVSPTVVSSRIAVSGRSLEAAHKEALTLATKAETESLIWGQVNRATLLAIGPLYVTRFSGYPQFGGAYLPADFQLPQLPPDDLCKVVRLIVATDSAEFMLRYQLKFGDVLEPLIHAVRAIVDDSRNTAGWSPDTRARMNLILGIANRTSGTELKSRDSLDLALAYFQRALNDWTRDRNPIEWAMTQRNIADTLSQQFGLGWNSELLHPLMAAFQDALTVYQSRSDRLDLAHVHLGIASCYEVISRYEPGRNNVANAVEYYRKAVDEYDLRDYPDDWADAQLKLANALRVLSFWEGTKDIEQAIAANKEALKVYSKRYYPFSWAQAQGQLAQSLSQLGQATSNPDDFRQSISLLRQVLDGYPRDQAPGEWSGLESTLGDALMALYDLDQKQGRDYPGQALNAYRAALAELTPQDNPIGWAQAKAGAGNALEELGYNNSDKDYLNQAIDAYNDSLKIFRRDRQPVQWATVKYELGEAYVYLGEQGPGVKYLQQGLQTYREALSALPADSPPDLRKDIQDGINTALSDLHQRGSTAG